MARGIQVQTTKQRFVEETFQLIQEDGLEHLTVRKIAQRVGCTAAALYRHFESVDYLSVLASLRFLDDYFHELQKMQEEEEDPISLTFHSWARFNYYAFHNPPIFLHLFWGSYSYYLEEATTEYLQLFPEQANRYASAYFCVARTEKSLKDRDFVWLRKAANQGYLKYDDAVYISKINYYMVHGALLEHIADYKDPEVAQKAAEECTELIHNTIRARLLK